MDNCYFCSMISVLEHIEYLIARHDCVIVPGFGAFIAQYASSSCDGDGINWKKPMRQISFNGDLIHNDGLLANSIIRKEGCNINTANTEIRENVANFYEQLRDGEELAFGKIGIFRQKEGKVVFEPFSKRDSACEYYGIESFSIQPLSYVEKEDAEHSSNNGWRISFNRSYLQIAAAIFALLVISFALSTPVPFKDKTQDYASMSSFQLPGDDSFPFVSNVKELAIMMPRQDADSVVVKSYRSSGGASIAEKEEDKYYLIVCSVLSRAEAEKFISMQNEDYDFRILEKNGKYRVYVATGNSINGLMKMKYEIANDFPDAWVHYSR